MSIYNTAVNKPISTLMVFIAIMVLGVASYIQLPVDQYPKMDPPYLTVMATYPGANASDIEENVTKILEDQLNSVDNLKEMTSTSYDNLGVISLEFEWEANLDEASNDVRDAVDKAMQNLPDDIDRPTIMRFNTSMMPILIYAVTADQSYPGIDKILDDKLITRLNRVDGVASVIVAGAPERVVYVDLDPNKLDAYNLTLEQIGNKILAENKDVSSGNVKMGLMDYALRIEGEFEESDQIKNIVLGTQNNKTIYLHDVAVVRDTIKDITLEQTINRGRGGVLMITKQTDANAVAVAKEAKKQLEKTTDEALQLAGQLKQLQREEEKLQADRTATAEQMAKRSSAALQQEKFRQERETLENLLKSWEWACKELEEKQSAYRDGIQKRDNLRKTYQAMESLFLDAQAGILAEKLTEGEPCPVCGAIHHPQPAKRAEHTPDKATLDQKKEELREQEETAADG